MRPQTDWSWRERNISSIIFYCYTGEKPYMAQPSIFPQGYEAEDYTVFILVRVDDFIGSYSDLELRVRVSNRSFKSREREKAYYEIEVDNMFIKDMVFVEFSSKPKKHSDEFLSLKCLGTFCTHKTHCPQIYNKLHCLKIMMVESVP